MSALCAIIAVVNNAASVTDLIIGCRHVLAVGRGREASFNQYVSGDEMLGPWEMSAVFDHIYAARDSLLYIFPYAAACIMYVAAMG